MINIIARNEEKLFNELITVRGDSRYQFTKTAEECSELSKAAIKLVNTLEDGKANVRTGNLEKVNKYVRDIIEEIVDVQLQLFILKIELIKDFIPEKEFENLYNEKYIQKMKIIRSKIDVIKESKSQEALERIMKASNDY